ncbi:MAG: hypothetical protein ACE5DO_12760, partial [Desulfobacterales bacterium]
MPDPIRYLIVVEVSRFKSPVQLKTLANKISILQSRNATEIYVPGKKVSRLIQPAAENGHFAVKYSSPLRNLCRDCKVIQFSIYSLLTSKSFDGAAG